MTMGFADFFVDGFVGDDISIPLIDHTQNCFVGGHVHLIKWQVRGWRTMETS